MTVKITYELDMFEEKETAKEIIDHISAYSDLNDIYNEARSMLKHGDITNVDDVEKCLERIKELSWRE